MNATSRCAHPACNCVPADGSKYCSAPGADAKRNHGTSLPMPASCLRRRKSEAIANSLAQIQTHRVGPMWKGAFECGREPSFGADSEMADESDVKGPSVRRDRMAKRLSR